jgi:NADH-quinone oxidoreductase subunit H
LLFLGGWNGPIPVATLTGLSEGTGDTANYFVRLIGCGNLILKSTLGVLLMMWVRWTLPRLRIDQVMATCLKYCTPIAAAMFAGAMLWQLAFPGGVVRGMSRPAGEIREGWLEGPGGLAIGRGLFQSKPVAVPPAAGVPVGERQPPAVESPAVVQVGS